MPSLWNFGELSTVSTSQLLGKLPRLYVFPVLAGLAPNSRHDFYILFLVQRCLSLARCCSNQCNLLSGTVLLGQADTMASSWSGFEILNPLEIAYIEMLTGIQYPVTEHVMLVLDKCPNRSTKFLHVSRSNTFISFTYSNFVCGAIWAHCQMSKTKLFGGLEAIEDSVIYYVFASAFTPPIPW
jgi:hypothetical protein